MIFFFWDSLSQLRSFFALLLPKIYAYLCKQNRDKRKIQVNTLLGRSNAKLVVRDMRILKQSHHTHLQNNILLKKILADTQKTRETRQTAIVIVALICLMM